MARPRITLISSSLAQKSRSRLAIVALKTFFETQDIDTDLIDLRDHDIGLYPAGKRTAPVNALIERFHAADAWVFASPVYNWEVSAALRNFLHYTLTESERRYRPFLIILAAGGVESLLAGDALGRTIIHEEYAVQVGPAVLVTGKTVDREQGTVSDEATQVLTEAATALIAYAKTSYRLKNSINS